MARKLSIFRYIAINNPNAAISLVRSYDNTGRKITSEKQLVSALKRISLDNKDESFAKKILDIHPDKQIFDSVKNNEIKKVTSELKENYLNLVDETKVATPLTEEQKKEKQQQDTKITNIAIGVLIGLGITISIVGLVKMVIPKS